MISNVKIDRENYQMELNGHHVIDLRATSSQGECFEPIFTELSDMSHLIQLGDVDDTSVSHAGEDLLCNQSACQVSRSLFSGHWPFR